MKAKKIIAALLTVTTVFGASGRISGDILAGADGSGEDIVTYRIDNMIIPVEAVTLKVTEPKAGEKPHFEVSTTTKGVEVVGKPRWFSPYCEINEYMTFEPDTEYSVQISVKNLDGYMLNDDVKVTINGKTASEPLDGGSIRTFSVSFRTAKPDNSSSKADNSSSKSENSSSKAENSSSKAGNSSKADNSSSKAENSSSKADNSSSQTDYSSKNENSSSKAGSSSKSENSSSKAGNSSKADTSSSAEKPKYTLGDVNGDKKIDIEDAVMVIQHLNGVKPLTDAQYKRANVDRNKTVDIEDAVAIISHVNGVKAIK